MKILSIINPQGWIGQLVLIAAIMGSAYAFGLYKGTKDCPPVTQNNIEQHNKAKKGATISSSANISQDQDNCLECFRSHTIKEIRQIKKGL